MSLLESKLMSAGTPLPFFPLKDISGRMIGAKDYSSHKLLLIVFTCNHCPYAKASWPVLTDLYQRYHKEGLQIIAVNPNNHPDYPEDSFEKMKSCAKENDIRFPYVFDEDQHMARSYDAVCTPDPFLFIDHKLFYHGRINDNWKEPEKVTEKSLENFILAALKPEMSQPSSVHPSMGCSIKWVNQLP